jgi:hypothetical protein
LTRVENSLHVIDTVDECFDLWSELVEHGIDAPCPVRVHLEEDVEVVEYEQVLHGLVADVHAVDPGALSIYELPQTGSQLITSVALSQAKGSSHISSSLNSNPLTTTFGAAMADLVPLTQ